MSVLLGNSGASVILGSSGGGVVRRGETKQTLSASDFTYVGSFRLPTTSGPTGSEVQNIKLNAIGPTIRYVTGELRIGFGTNVYEFGGIATRAYVEFYVPASLEANPASYATAPVAAQAAFFNQTICGTKAVPGTPGAVTTHDSSGTTLRSVYWDETNGRLWWTYGIAYPSGFGTDAIWTEANPSFGYSTLNDGTSTLTPVGVWSTGESYKWSADSLVLVPAWFSTAYLGGGTKLLCSNSGAYSVVSMGPGSWGPTAVVVDTADPNSGSYPHNSVVPSDVLAHHTYNTYPLGVLPAYDRDHYNLVTGSWVPTAVSTWYYQDNWKGGVWIDTDPTSPTSGKSGLVHFAGLWVGGYTYFSSADQVGSGDSYIGFTDPSELAAVAGATKNAGDVTIRLEEWNWPHLITPMGGGGTQYDETRASYSRAVSGASPALTLPGGGRLPGWADGRAPLGIDGAAFDPATNRLYCFVSGCIEDGAEDQGAVFVYEVA